MNIFIYIFTAIISLIVGALIGLFWVMIYNKIQNKQIQKRALKVLNGELENKCEIDGQVFNAYSFKVRDENNKEILINLKEMDKIIPKNE